MISTRIREHLVEVVDGQLFRALSPATTWASLAPFLPDDALVAAADALRWVPRKPGASAADRPPRASLNDLEAAIQRGRWPGILRLRRTLAMSRDGAASPQESRVRLLLAAAGLPEPALDQDVIVDEKWLACMDLLYEDFKVGIEYQSAFHRGPVQYSADIDRRERLTHAGRIVVEVTNAHLVRGPQEVVRRVRSALQSRGYHSRFPEEQHRSGASPAWISAARTAEIAPETVQPTELAPQPQARSTSAEGRGYRNN